MPLVQAEKSPKQAALEALRSRAYRPTQLLEHLACELSDIDIVQLKDAVFELLEERVIELSGDRTIHIRKP